MSTKQELIKEMIAMQKQFIEFEQKNGIHPDDYYNPGAGHDLDGYKETYMEKAIKVLDIAHEQHGSAWKS